MAALLILLFPFFLRAHESRVPVQTALACFRPAGSINAYMLREVARIKPGARIRVSAQCAPLEGQLVGTTPDALIIRSPAGDEPAAFRDIGAIWVRTNNVRPYATFGARMGAVAGGAYFLLAAPILCSSRHAGSECWKFAGRFLRPALIGTAYGATLGAVAGTLTTRWDRRFPPRGWR